MFLPAFLEAYKHILRIGHRQSLPYNRSNTFFHGSWLKQFGCLEGSCYLLYSKMKTDGLTQAKEKNYIAV